MLERPGMQHGHKGRLRQQLQSKREFRKTHTGDCEANDQLFCQDVENERWDTVEGSAPSETEK
jgi:hypothetical protein